MKYESDRLLNSIASIDAVINRLENTQFMIEESQKRDAEEKKEAAHRKEEGLD